MTRRCETGLWNRYETHMKHEGAKQIWNGYETGMNRLWNGCMKRVWNGGMKQHVFHTSGFWILLCTPGILIDALVSQAEFQTNAKLGFAADVLRLTWAACLDAVSITFVRCVMLYPYCFILFSKSHPEARKKKKKPKRGDKEEGEEAGRESRCTCSIPRFIPVSYPFPRSAQSPEEET